jgi:seryl-tRNA synthetase
MWKQLGDYIKQVLQVQQETQKNKADIVELRQELKEVRQELRNLTAGMQQIAHEVIRNRQNEQHEREKMAMHFEHEREKIALRFEMELLRSGRQLPTNPPNKEQDES